MSHLTGVTRVYLRASFLAAVIAGVAACEDGRLSTGARDAATAHDAGAFDAAGRDAASAEPVDSGASASVDAGHDTPPDAGMVLLPDAGVPPRPDAGTPLVSDAGIPSDAGSAACPMPAGASADGLAAVAHQNAIRLAMGIGCATIVPAIETSATRHCAYYAANRGNATCTGNAHVEVSGCAMFVAANFDARMRAAGYTGSPSSETMAFSGNGPSAVQQWVDSVWHRTPVLSPWVADVGYGGTTGCDTMDFGVGSTSPMATTATYPYAGQMAVPLSFDGRFEGPMPPAPPTGWPSGYPVHVYARMATITAHVFTVDGSSTPIDHTWLAPGAPASLGLLRNEHILYAHAPLSPSTRYHVHVEGTYVGGPLVLDWTFTTAAR